jgi:hypothetical protein
VLTLSVNTLCKDLQRKSLQDVDEPGIGLNLRRQPENSLYRSAD